LVSWQLTVLGTLKISEQKTQAIVTSYADRLRILENYLAETALIAPNTPLTDARFAMEESVSNKSNDLVFISVPAINGTGTSRFYSCQCGRDTHHRPSFAHCAIIAQRR
jgi:hypothetical protein